MEFILIPKKQNRDTAQVVAQPVLAEDFSIDTDPKTRIEHSLLRNQIASLEIENGRLRAFVDKHFDNLLQTLSNSAQDVNTIQNLVSTYDMAYFVNSVYTYDQLVSIAKVLVQLCKGRGAGNAIDLWISIIEKDVYTVAKINGQ